MYNGRSIWNMSRFNGSRIERTVEVDYPTIYHSCENWSACPARTRGQHFIRPILQLAGFLNGGKRVRSDDTRPLNIRLTLLNPVNGRSPKSPLQISLSGVRQSVHSIEREKYMRHLSVKKKKKRKNVPLFSCNVRSLRSLNPHSKDPN